MRLFFSSLFFLVFLPIAAAEELKAGAAKVDITPPLGFPMWGYGARHDAGSTGVLDPLKARALVLAIGSEKIALVSLDLGRAPTRQSTQAIRVKVKAAAGVEHLFLVGSHTHHGPVIELDDWPSPKNSYVRELEQKLANVIIEADKNLRPAKVGIASKEVPFNRNRHSKLAEKPVDREFLVLRVDDMEGKPIAHAVNFAAHPTMREARDLRFSADYPGPLAAVVEKETGAPCLFLQAAAGDLSPNPGMDAGPDAFGQRLGQTALDMAKTIQCTTTDKHKLQVSEDNFQFKSRIDLTNPAIKAGYVNAFFQGIVDFYDREYAEGVRPHLTTALLDSKIGFVGVSGEFFCGHSLSLKQRARLEYVLFLGYCNDYQQYFPTIQAAAEGGYGADATVAAAEVGSGELMINRALIHFYQMRGKLTDLRPRD
jgi:hypothetical protein